MAWSPEHPVVGSSLRTRGRACPRSSANRPTSGDEDMTRTGFATGLGCLAAFSGLGAADILVDVGCFSNINPIPSCSYDGDFEDHVSTTEVEGYTSTLGYTMIDIDLGGILASVGGGPTDRHLDRRLRGQCLRLPQSGSGHRLRRHHRARPGRHGPGRVRWHHRGARRGDLRRALGAPRHPRRLLRREPPRRRGLRLPRPARGARPEFHPRRGAR